MQKHFAITFAAITLCSSSVATDVVADRVADTLRGLAERIPYLNASDFIYDRMPDTSGREYPFTDDQRIAYDEFWKLGHSVEVERLSESLSDDNPKVRTLAMVAAYWSDRPEVFLPTVRDMINDTRPSFSSTPMIMSSFPRRTDPIPLEQHTVADFAHDIVRRYLVAAGSHYDIEGGGRKPGFDDYWDERKDLAYCPSWFHVYFWRASQLITPMRKDRMDNVRAVRAKIDLVPSPDREWILLLLAAPYEWGGAAASGADVLAPEPELVDALRTLGARRLLKFLRREPISEHPDFRFDPRGQFAALGYERAALFILRHAMAVFTAEHAEELLELAAIQRTRKENHEFRLETPRWAIAAADLTPERADEILRSTRPLFAEGKYSTGQDDRALLAIALWERVGEGAIAEVMTWFFNERPDRGAIGFGRQRLCDYLGQPGSRALLLALLKDERLDKLDWGTLDRLVRAANRLSDEPVVTEDELRRASHPFGEGHYAWQRERAWREYPIETTRLERTLSMWRERLRRFAVENQ